MLRITNPQLDYAGLQIQRDEHLTPAEGITPSNSLYLLLNILCAFASLRSIKESFPEACGLLGD